jgi:hypothetical protein
MDLRGGRYPDALPFQTDAQADYRMKNILFRTLSYYRSYYRWLTYVYNSNILLS